MTSLHERNALGMLARLEAASGGLETLADYRHGLRDRRWPDAYVDAIGQVFRCRPASWPAEQIAAFAVVHGWITTGRIAVVTIKGASGPGADACREDNAAELAELPKPFRADLNMTQNCADDDGTMTWDEPVMANVAGSLALIPPATVPVPLEVGTSDPSRTFLHVFQEGGVARWAYGQHEIWILVNLGDRSGTVLSKRHLAYKAAQQDPAHPEEGN